MKQKVSSTLMVEMQIGVANVENSMEFSFKTKNKTILWPSNSTTGYISQRKKNINKKEI